MPTLDEFIADLDAPHRETAERLRAVIAATVPDATGQLWHGHPVWLSGKNPVVGFKPFPRYVTLMIWNAAPIVDRSGVLVPGARMSTVKYESPGQVDPVLVRDWLAQATA